ncbi:hypothetical protein ECG_00580 [Echinococcus granulosus]|uniref:Expressed protein n=1 Tax=Echinococcus granulosus TaxID=6210 RepID=A0A068WA69_ECHGR|nr:hypothetical protein ECG_00580 [Echinococcus granulosus]CDS16571.1 expressed protein [Echinococcus granulosus]
MGHTESVYRYRCDLQTPSLVRSQTGAQLSVFKASAHDGAIGDKSFVVAIGINDITSTPRWCKREKRMRAITFHQHSLTGDRTEGEV